MDMADHNSYSSSQSVLFFTSFGPNDMRARTYPVAGFIVPYKCYGAKSDEKCKYTCARCSFYHGGCRYSVLTKVFWCKPELVVSAYSGFSLKSICFS